MPVKKGGKKNIAEEPKETTPRVNIREKFFTEQGARERKISVWLWVGMTIVIILIVGFWGYSIYFSVSTINWKKTEESKLINKTTTNWDQIFQKREDELQREQAIKNIKNILNQAITQSINNAVTVSTTTSTTSTISTTTIISTTTNR